MGGYVQPKEIAALVRANIKAAQASGALDRKWKISVRTELASMCAEVAVRIQGEHVTDEFLFGGGGSRTRTAASQVVAEQVRKCMAPAFEWANGQHRFACLYWRDGLCA